MSDVFKVFEVNKEFKVLLLLVKLEMLELMEELVIIKQPLFGCLLLASQVFNSNFNFLLCIVFRQTREHQ